MSSSGLIYAVIVGAWAAYLVPMWLRRQDELNEARPTERFSTAIRLLSGKAAMERRYAKEAERRAADSSVPSSDGDDADGNDPDVAADDAVDVRAFAEPRTMAHETVPPLPEAKSPEGREREGREREPGPRGSSDRTGAERTAAERKAAERKAAERTKRAKVLARRRRTTMVLFLFFSVGAVVAAVGGLAFLWAPAAPAALLSAYIAHLRTQERRRFHVTMDRRRAEEAAVHLRKRRGRTRSRTRAAVAPVAEPESTRLHTELVHPVRPAPQPVPRPAPQPSAPPTPERASAADRRALVEQTDHAEWVDQERGRVREQPEGEGWEPVPVPLPTYVSAPVAPRTARGVDLDAPDAWSSARSTTAPAASADSTASAAPSGAEAGPAAAPASRSRRDRTPLFDQMADRDRPRAANE